MPVSDLARGLSELAAAEPAYAAASGYYTGKVDEFFSNKSIERQIAGQAKDKFRLPFAAIAVDKPIDMIEVTSVSAASGDAVSKVLRERIWDANDLDSDILDVYRQAAKFGDYYVTIWPESDDDEALDDETGGEDAGDGTGFVEVYMNSPLAMRAIYSRENSRRVLFYVKVWTADETDEAGNPRWRANLYYRDRIEQYITRVGAKGGAEPKDFVAYPEVSVEDGEDDPSIIPNEWGGFPCFHYHPGNSKPYGTPLHARAFGAQDAITKLNVTHLSTVDFIGYPQRYALLDEDAADDGSDDDFIEFETSGVANTADTTAKVEVTRKRSKLRSGPGETWWLQGVKEVGQFETAGAEPFLDPIKFQVSAMALLTDIPAEEFNLDGTAQQPSGEARRQSRAGLVSKVKSLIASYRRTTESMLELALAMLGYPGEKVAITYAPLVTMEGKDDWDTIETKTKNGVPIRVALAEAGYPEEQIAKWYPKGEGEPASIAQVTAILAAVASAGQAVTLGAIGTDDVRRLLGQYLPGQAPELVRPPVDPADLDPTTD